jgi:predicted deacylase
MPTKPLWAEQKTGRFYTEIDVTTNLRGRLTLPLHVLTGKSDGPTLVVTATIHGDETLPALMLRRLLNEIDADRLAGRLCALPVCNPMALAVFDRQTPEQHGRTDLHEVFPGNPKGNLTQMMAAAISAQVVEFADVVIDYHCGGSGGRLQDRVDVHHDANEQTRTKSLDLARQFGTIMVHDNSLAGSVAGYANGLGKTAFNAETAGVYLSSEHTADYAARGVRGLRSVMAALGMLHEKPTPRPRQLLYGTSSRIEVNPGRAGFLESQFDRPDQLGTRVARGTVLGRLIDMFSLEVVEEMVAPIDGYLFFSRYSGTVDAGTKAFALAEEATSKWLEP